LTSALRLHQAGRWNEAESLYQAILTQAPELPDALHGYGLLLYQTGRLTPAAELLGEATELAPANPTFRFNHGVILQRLGRLDDALTAYRKAVELRPGYRDARANIGTVLFEQGRYQEAITLYDDLLRAEPQSAELWNNLGAANKELGRFDQAITAYQQALALKPAHVEARCNLGLVLAEQGRLDEAVTHFRDTLRANPDSIKAHYDLAFTRLWQGRPEDAMAEFRRSAELKHHHRKAVGAKPIYHTRLKHDSEQIHYLLDKGRISAGYRPYLDALERLRPVIRRRAGEKSWAMASAEELRDISPSFNEFLYVADAPTLPGGALNPALDVTAIETEWDNRYPEIMYIDQLLTEEALASLRRFCWESTIWKREYENGYMGAFLGDGFACPLLLQIAEELRVRFPRIFKQHRLMQSWSFKQDSEMKGLNLHADAAAVNLNFWITPDEANLDPDRGGLIVWDKEAPKEWNFKDYNSSKNEPTVREFLRTSGAKAVSIPYRANRAVLFNSDVFHETDRATFKTDYTSRRINITLLYGRRSA
jgi:Flp pilus assembly protein TadD